tara:strand:+ start:2431 stop:2604 length:174 start_codon:yes stop_codon:yes gene_type:complete
MSRVKIIEAISRGLERIIKAIRCKSVCCVGSSCNEPPPECVECKYLDKEGKAQVHVV